MPPRSAPGSPAASTIHMAPLLLRIFRITAWDAEPRPMEGQQLSWQDPNNLRLDPVLPAHQKVLDALNLPPIYAISEAGKLGMGLFLERLQRVLSQETV